MSTNNDNGDGGKQSQGRYVYQAYQTLPAVTSVEDFAKRMLNIVARGNSDQHHKQFLTNKLNQIGSIVHRQNQGWQISYDEKMTLLLAETWCLNHMMNSLSTFSIFVYFVLVFIKWFDSCCILFYYFVFPF